MATEDKSAVEATTEANLPNGSEKDVDRALLRKIDWRVMPVVNLYRPNFFAQDTDITCFPAVRYICPSGKDISALLEQPLGIRC